MQDLKTLDVTSDNKLSPNSVCVLKELYHFGTGEARHFEFGVHIDRSKWYAVCSGSRDILKFW